MPLAAGVGSGVLTLLEKNPLLVSYSEFAVIGFSILGMIVTFGLFMWELHNIQKCKWLIAQAGDFEWRLFGYEQPINIAIQFDGLPGEETVSSLIERPWAKTQPVKVIYVLTR